MPRVRWVARGVLILLLGAGGVSMVRAQGGIPVGSPAPAVTVNDLDGTPVDLGALIGKQPVLLEFWATWCPNCEKLLPQLIEAGTRYRGQVAFIGVNVTVNQSKDRVRRYLERHHPPFTVLWDDRGVAVRAFDVPGTSFVAIIDREGKVAYTGYGEDQDLLAALARVVGR